MRSGRIDRATRSSTKTASAIFSLYVLLAPVIFFLLAVFIVSIATRVETGASEFEAVRAAASNPKNRGPTFGIAAPMGVYGGFPVAMQPSLDSHLVVI